MGFFNDISLLPKIEQKKYLETKTTNYLEKKEDITICRHCKSSNTEFIKTLGFGKKQGNVYHYKLICEDCGKTYHVKRCKEVFDKVKDSKWIYSKNAKKQYLNY